MLFIIESRHNGMHGSNHLIKYKAWVMAKCPGNFQTFQKFPKHFRILYGKPIYELSHLKQSLTLGAVK